MSSQPTKQLQTFVNPAPERDYEIAFDVPEFTCLCPLTGQPDFARFRIRYVPDELCVELKSLKLYMWSYRDEGAFHEKVTNTIADDIVRAIQPRKLVVEGDFFVRGGIGTLVTVTHEQAERRAAKASKPAAASKPAPAARPAPASKPAAASKPRK